MGNLHRLGLLITLAGLSLVAPAQVSLEVVGQWGGESYCVEFAGDLLYAGVGPRVIVLDPSGSGAPAVVGVSPILPFLVSELAIAGQYCYVADAYGGLQVLDVSEPTAPRWVGGSDLGSQTKDIKVAGGYAYVVIYNKALLVFEDRAGDQGSA